ncbi:MAG: RNA polymerase factor sigma-54 [Deltaproteobacteria bacterium]|nr:RNA polymerase factor sigma-54 [Deltaproteobacteria bacterium]MCL5793175.1 RNA polymerase factor sigma-54 [Deltaproteobacteria bacterium]
MIDIRQEVNLRQQLELTPQLIQALRLLQLNRLELEQELKTELELNPFLEEEPIEQIELSQDIEERITHSDANHTTLKERGEDPIENTAHRDMGFHDYLLWQLELTISTDQEFQIGEILIGNINDDGYLESTVDEISKFTGAGIEQVEEVLKKIQGFDPSGVGARDLKECLLIQLSHLGIENPIIKDIVLNHLNNLERKAYHSISKAIGVNVEIVMAAANAILRLNPKPGSLYHSETEENYIIPDVVVYKNKDAFVVELIEDGMPGLRYMDYYARKVLDEIGNNDTAKKFIKEKLYGAKWLIKAVEQRKNTIKRVVRAIVMRQESFFEYGDKYLQPMVLKDIANDINVHETTVGRVTNGKYVQTQWGIYELKYFFTTSLKTESGELLSTKLVKQKIKEIIGKENNTSPLSDTDIVRFLKVEGISIARRTVAKYRELMNIRPVHMRRVKVL